MPLPLSDPKTGRSATLNLNGYKKELGQTLSSTGLTLWSATESMLKFILEEAPDSLLSGSCVELGCGLAAASMAVDWVQRERNLRGTMTATDGDSEVLTFAKDNIKVRIYIYILYIYYFALGAAQRWWIDWQKILLILLIAS